MPKVAKNMSFTCLHLIGENKQTKLGAIFSLQELLVQSYGAKLLTFGNTFLNFVSNFSLEGGNWVKCLWQQFLKWCILNLPFCSIFVPFHFYLIMTLVVPCSHNMFMVLLTNSKIFSLQTPWRIVCEQFPQLCIKFQPWRRQFGHMFMTTPYS